MFDKVIGIHPTASLRTWRGLLSCLSELFAVKFVEWPHQDSVRLNAGIVLPGGTVHHGLAQRAGVPRLLVFSGDAGVQEGRQRTVRFADSSSVHTALRGQLLSEEKAPSGHSLAAVEGDEILATVEGKPVWLRRRHDHGTLDFVAAVPPGLGDGERGYDYYRRGRFMGMLPLLSFLQDVTREVAWELPPLRACLMFDDPNLHWLSYGFVDYRELARHAAQHNYHVAFATIPLDGWRVHPRTAELFRQHKDRLSLLVHGNNHTHRELGRAGDEADMLPLVAQALRRIEGIERKAAVEIARVMAPPHGACSAASGSALRRLGFEAVCVSRGSLQRSNPDASWPRTFGLGLVENLGGGLPVIARFGLSADFSADIILRAFLQQPIIPIGHHNDLADGLELMAELAGKINRLGGVAWADMKTIARSNFLTRKEGNVQAIRLHSRVACVPTAPDVTELRIECPALQEGQEELFVVRQNGEQVAPCEASGRCLMFQVQSAEVLQARVVCRERLEPARLRVPSTRLWPVARRLLKEAVDRVQPCLGTPRRPAAIGRSLGRQPVGA
ncbi:MAG: hypothetical protein HYY24_02005 [Verrucomicrobia bacterium]|nr:hypothetical protein [Verrucomicrobiota bacterium]